LHLIAALEFLFLVGFTRERLDHPNASECLLHSHYHFAHAFKLTPERFARASPVDPKRYQTGWKKNQCNQREFPIHEK